MTAFKPILGRFARRYLFADAAPLSPLERRRSALATLLGVLIFEGALFVLPVSADARRLLAPLGASSVILFALPHSPLAQPWSLVGGLMLPALVGFACGRWVPVGYLTVGLAIAMIVNQTFHFGPALQIQPCGSADANRINKVVIKPIEL